MPTYHAAGISLALSVSPLSQHPPPSNQDSTPASTETDVPDSERLGEEQVQLPESNDCHLQFIGAATKVPFLCVKTVRRIDSPLDRVLRRLLVAQEQEAVGPAKPNTPTENSSVVGASSKVSATASLSKPYEALDSVKSSGRGSRQSSAPRTTLARQDENHRGSTSRINPGLSRSLPGSTNDSVGRNSQSNSAATPSEFLRLSLDIKFDGVRPFRRGPDSEASDLQISVFLNGELSNNIFVAKNGKHSSMITITGRKTGNVIEHLWLFKIPPDGNMPKPDSGKAIPSTRGSRNEAARRWNDICAALGREVEAMGLDNGCQAPSAAYLTQLSKSGIPEELNALKTTPNVNFAVLDVVFTVGSGKRRPSGWSSKPEYFSRADAKVDSNASGLTPRPKSKAFSAGQQRSAAKATVQVRQGLTQSLLASPLTQPTRKRSTRKPNKRKLSAQQAPTPAPTSSEAAVGDTNPSFVGNTLDGRNDASKEPTLRPQKRRKPSQKLSIDTSSPVRNVNPGPHPHSQRPENKQHTSFTQQEPPTWTPTTFRNNDTRGAPQFVRGFDPAGYTFTSPGERHIVRNEPVTPAHSRFDAAHNFMHLGHYSAPAMMHYSHDHWAGHAPFPMATGPFTPMPYQMSPNFPPYPYGPPQTYGPQMPFGYFPAPTQQMPPPTAPVTPYVPDMFQSEQVGSAMHQPGPSPSHGYTHSLQHRPPGLFEETAEPQNIGDVFGPSSSGFPPPPGRSVTPLGRVARSPLKQHDTSALPQNIDIWYPGDNVLESIEQDDVLNDMTFTELEPQTKPNLRGGPTSSRNLTADGQSGTGTGDGSAKIQSPLRYTRTLGHTPLTQSWLAPSGEEDFILYPSDDETSDPANNHSEKACKLHPLKEQSRLHLRGGASQKPTAAKLRPSASARSRLPPKQAKGSTTTTASVSQGKNHMPKPLAVPQTDLPALSQGSVITYADVLRADEVDEGMRGLPQDFGTRRVPLERRAVFEEDEVLLGVRFLVPADLGLAFEGGLG